MPLTFRRHFWDKLVAWMEGPPVKSDPSPSQSVMSVPPGALPLRKNQAPPLGLRNLRNSCYLNSVLQCLTFTPPLAEYCLLQLHSTSCPRSKASDCTFCILEEQIRSSLVLLKPVDAPRKLHTRMMSNANYFKPGRHEDAHELLRFLIEDCGKAFRSQNQQEKTVPEGLFGGVLESHIECRSCGAVSTKHDDMMDLSLDICDIKSLALAFACFCRPELLDGDNKYRCESCKEMSAAQKRMSIHRSPKVLTIQLKRFDPLSGKKLNHHIQFEGRLTIADYMTEKLTPPGDPQYTLYAVVVHEGSSKLWGHYYAFVKETNGKWYQCDDETVREVSEDRVLAANSYLLFYIRSEPSVIQSASQDDLAEPIVIQSASQEDLAKPIVIQSASQEDLAEPTVIQSASQEDLAEPTVIQSASQEDLAEPTVIQSASQEDLAELIVIQSASQEDLAEPTNIEFTTRALQEKTKRHKHN